MIGSFYGGTTTRAYLDEFEVYLCAHDPYMHSVSTEEDNEGFYKLNRYKEKFSVAIQRLRYIIFPNEVCSELLKQLEPRCHKLPGKCTYPTGFV